MVTDRPGIALGIVTADCAPVLFADPAAGVIGAAHAGWRGAVDGVLEATLAAMEAIGAAARASPPPSAPASPSRATRSAADLRDAVLAHAAADAAILRRRHGARPLAIRPGRLLRRPPRAAGIGTVETPAPTHWPTRTASSATAAGRWPAAARSATRCR